MKNHNEVSGASFPEFQWNEVSLGILPPIKEGTQSELVRLVTTEGKEGLGYFDYSYGWKVEAIVGNDRHMAAAFHSVKAWKAIELYEERWQPKPSKPKPERISTIGEDGE